MGRHTSFARLNPRRVFEVEKLEERQLFSSLTIFGQQMANGTSYAIGTLDANTRNPNVINSTFTLNPAYRNLLSDKNGWQFRYFQVITYDDEPATVTKFLFGTTEIPAAGVANHTGDGVDPPSGGWDYQSTSGGADTSPFYENDDTGTAFAYPSYATEHAADGTDPGTVRFGDAPGLAGKNHQTLFETFITFVNTDLLGSNVVDVLGGFAWGVKTNAAGQESTIAPTNVPFASIDGTVVSELQGALGRSGFGGVLGFGGWTVTANDVIIPPPVSVPVDGGAVQLKGVLPGETVTLQANYTTSDPNENGEGETVNLSSTGGFSGVDSTYNTITIFTFTATQQNESVQAASSGFDGDETTDIQASYSLASNGGANILAPDLQNALSTAAQQYDTTATGIGTVAQSIGDSTLADATGLSNAAWVNAGLLAAAGQSSTQLAIDPVDTNYKVIVRPRPASQKILSHPSDFKGMKNAASLAAAIDAYDLNQENAINLASAMDATVNKLAGAAAAGDTRWEKRQAGVLKSYKLREAGLLAQQSKLASNAAAQLNNTGAASQSVSSDDVANFESTLADGSLPPMLATTLTALGIDPTTQDQIRQALLVQDTSLASGTYQSLFANTALANGINTTATLMRTT